MVQTQTRKLTFLVLGTQHPSAVAYDCVYYILLIQFDVPAVARDNVTTGVITVKCLAMGIIMPSRSQWQSVRRPFRDGGRLCLSFVMAIAISMLL